MLNGPANQRRTPQGPDRRRIDAEFRARPRLRHGDLWNPRHHAPATGAHVSPCLIAIHELGHFAALARRTKFAHRIANRKDGIGMHAGGQTKRRLGFLLELQMPRGQCRAKTKRTDRQQHVLHGGINRRASGAVRVRTVLQTADDPDGRFVVMIRQVFDRAVLALVLVRVAAGWRRAGRVTRADDLIERLLVPDLHRFLDRRILHHHEAPLLRVAAVRGAKTGVQDLLDQFVRHGIRLQPPHRARVAHDFEYIVHLDLLFVSVAPPARLSLPSRRRRATGTGAAAIHATMCVPVTLPKSSDERYSTTPATSFPGSDA